MRVAAVQCKVGVVDTFKSALDLIKEGVENNVELFLLPEYFSYQRGDDFSEKTKETLKFLKNTSREYSCTICGNVLIKQENKYFNTAHLFKEGELIGTQEKIHPTKTERELKISCGSKVKTFSINSIRLAILICADILYPELCRVAGLKKADIVLHPVVSFKKTELPAEKLRNYLYFTRSFDNAYAVVKAGGVGYTFLATDILTEKHGVKEARKAVFIGFFTLIMTTLIMQITLAFIPDESDTLSPALEQIFGFMPDVMIASLTAYLISQLHDVWAFEFWKRKTKGKHLWLRNSASTMVSQLIDNVTFTTLFFVVFNPQFVQSLGLQGIFEIFITSYVMKFIVAVFDTPFIYLSKRIDVN